MIHVPIAIAAQLAGWVLLGFDPRALWVAGLAGIAMCFMREAAQAEYRWIEAHGGRRVAMPGWKGLDVRLWTIHSVRGVAVPALAVLIVALAGTMWL